MIKYKGEFYCDTKDAATLLDIPEYTIRRLINSKDLSKKIPAEKIDGKSYGIFFGSLLKYAKENGKESLLQKNIDKLKIKQTEKKVLLDIMGKKTDFADSSLIAPALLVAFAPIIAAAGLSFLGSSIYKNNVQSLNENSVDEDNVEQNQTNNTVQDSNLTSKWNTADILSLSLEYFKNQAELLDKTREELDYLLEQTKVSIRGIRINLKKTKEEDEKDQLKVMEHALEIQKIKIKSAISKFEKVTSK